MLLFFNPMVDVVLYLGELATNTLKERALDEIKQKEGQQKSDKLVLEFKTIIGKISSKQDVGHFLSYLLRCNSDSSSGSGPKACRAIKEKLKDFTASKFKDGKLHTPLSYCDASTV